MSNIFFLAGANAVDRPVVNQCAFAGDYEKPRTIPVWLRRVGESDAIDWQTVERYATQMKRRVPALAKTLSLRLDDRTGRPAAMAAARSEREAHEIENAWKWIDRNWRERIAPLFQLEKPPSTMIAEQWIAIVI